MLRVLSDRLRALLVLSAVLPFGIAIDACVSDGGGALATDGGEPPLPECSWSDAKIEADASQLRLNELMSDNDGAAVDELGETDDFIELYNTGAHAVELSTHVLRDESGQLVRLPHKQ